MSALATLVASALVVAALVGLGRLVLGRVLGRARALEGAGLALLVGWMAVAGVSHALNVVPIEVLPFVRIPSWLPVLAAAAIVGAWARGGVRTGGVCSAAERREARALGWATAGVVLLYLLQYDRDLFAFTCTHRAVSIATRVEVGALWSLVDVPRVLLFDEENDMHGVVAVLSVLPSVLGFFGVRLSYALLHAGLASASWVAARRAGFGVGPAAAAFGVLALHPALLGTPVDDVNHVALLASLVVWATILSVSAARSWGADAAFAVGLLTALAVGAWHPLLLSLPALALLAGLEGRRRWRPAAVGLVVGVLPFFVRHLVGLGGPFTFESFAENAAVTHAVAGAEFAWSGLLNWPFSPELIRTPGNPLPVALLLSAFLLATSGAAVAAVAIVGMVRSARAAGERRAGSAALLWVLPGIVLLAPQANWFEIEKLQIATVWLAPAGLWIAAGVAGLTTRRGWIAAVAATVALVGVGRALRAVDVPVDPRLQARWPHLRDERPEEVALYRARLTRGGLLPRFDVLGPDPRTARDRLQVLAEELAAPRFADRPESPREAGLRLAIPRVWQLFLEPRARAEDVGAAGAAVRALRIDLSDLPSAGPRVSAAPLPATAAGAWRRAAPLPWAPEARVAVFQQRGAPGDVHVIVAGPAPDLLTDLERDIPEMATVTLPPARAAGGRAVSWEVDGASVVVGLPEGARLRITEILSVEPSRIRRWSVDPGEPELRGPGFARHN